jgi:hypothetical protein
MKRSRTIEPTRGRSATRDLFAELNEGMEALADARQGKLSLRTHSMEVEPPLTVTPEELIRKNLTSRD